MTTIIVLAVIVAVIFFIYMFAFRGEYYNPDEIESHVKLSESEQKRYKKAAYEFANLLSHQKYNDAFELLDTKTQSKWNPSLLEVTYKKMIEYGDGPVNHVELIEYMDDFSGRKEDDIGWAYVAISGEGFNEAVTVIIRDENGKYKIRDVEWGRP